MLYLFAINLLSLSSYAHQKISGEEGVHILFMIFSAFIATCNVDGVASRLQSNMFTFISWAGDVSYFHQFIKNLELEGISRTF